MNDDLIKKSDAINTINKYCEEDCYYRVDHWCPQCQREEFEKAIQAIPSADKPTGKWIIEKTSNNNYNYRCSYCDWYETHAYPDVEPYNYCPNCGCRMEGATDGNK